MDAWKNQLYFGDNLEVLRRHIPVGSVDLVYLDPPFNSQATYNVLFAEKSGEKSAAQITAFEDTWHWGLESERAYREVMDHGPRKLADLLQALRSFLGANDMMAYLTMMAVRLVELHRVLKPTGSLYLHCDQTASHYLKMILDAIFGTKYFRNEIIWQRTRVAKKQSIFWGKVHDIIFLYTKSDDALFNKQYLTHPESYIKSHYNYMEEGTGRRYGLWDFTQKGDGPPRKFGESEIKPPKGKHWIWSQDRIDNAMKENRIIFTRSGMPRLKRYLDDSKGEYIQDIWTEIFDVNAVARERLGYPTQKPEALLERIIKASSHEGDLVLDPFCGCGTAVVVAERLHRRWVGMDITHLAITLIKKRLNDSFGKELAPYEVIGEPADATSAAALAEVNRHQFEWWALGMVDAAPAQDKKKGADRGVDGILYFQEKDDGPYHKIIVQVKSGHVGAPQVQQLQGAMAREKAQIGALLTLKPPTRPMREEAAAAGFYVAEHFPESRFPRLQILTIAELFAGRQLEYPRWVPPKTFKQAARRRKGPTPEEQQRGLL
jgi:site-specific DNA-methyltransferase (adenine-specific)